MLDYYGEPGIMTGLGRHGAFVDWLAGGVRVLSQVAQGLILHDGWASRYGWSVRREQLCARSLPSAEDILDKALQLDGRSLAIPRVPERRVIGCCREFALVVCAFLRRKGVPARCRCGFARYLASEGQFEDHWVCEYWLPAENRWARVDAQLDAFQQSTIRAAFDPLDVPHGQFITAGEAWLGCRQGTYAPMQFGISSDPAEYGLASLYGEWFVRGNLLRDLAALNNVETAPFLVRLAAGLDWNGWRLVSANDAELSAADYRLLDEVADLCAVADQAAFARLRRLFTETADLRPPDELFSGIA